MRVCVRACVQACACVHVHEAVHRPNQEHPTCLDIKNVLHLDVMSEFDTSLACLASYFVLFSFLFVLVLSTSCLVNKLSCQQVVNKLSN